MRQSPRALLWAAGVQAAEAAGLLAATVLAAIGTATGHAYHLSSGVALTVIGVVTAAALVVVAAGVAGARRWSRTPAVLTQLFTGIVGIYLLQAHRYGWGGPAVALAAGGLVSLFVPASVRALAGQQQVPPGGGTGSG